MSLFALLRPQRHHDRRRFDSLQQVRVNLAFEMPQRNSNATPTDTKRLIARILWLVFGQNFSFAHKRSPQSAIIIIAGAPSEMFPMIAATGR